MADEHDTFRGVERTSDNKLQGLRLGRRDGMSLEAAIKAFHDYYNALQLRRQLNPEPIVLHPEVFNHWVSEGWITADGQVNHNWDKKK
jgi:hypothetical protein